MSSSYAHPDALVTTQWVADHANDSSVAVAEVDVDTSSYEEGHVPGAIGWNWKTDLQNQTSRDLLNAEEVAELLGKAGISNDTTLVLYGDNNNWFAAWAYWFFQMYGHKNVKLMNGGRIKWLAEKRPLTQDLPKRTPTTYKPGKADLSMRALRDYVAHAVTPSSNIQLVDVRSPAEYSGRVIAPEHLPQEGAQRSGHIPGAQNIPWSSAVNEDGTFKSPEELRKIYGDKGIDGNAEVITYCRIGERSAHTWFVLNQLLGYPKVRNYDGSWTEWGSLVGAPIER